MRTFVALDPDPAFKARAAGAASRLEGRLRGVKLVRPEGMHLTLRFLGESAPERLLALGPRLRALASDCPAGTARSEGLRLFPEGRRPRVLVVGLVLPPPLLALQEGCERAAVEAGFPPEDRPFRPHVTLGRFRDGAPRATVPLQDLGEAGFAEVVLYRSELGSGGVVYTRLDSYPLAEP